MTNTYRPVHSAFESLRAAFLTPRMTVRGRPACFATNEQLTSLGFSHLQGNATRRFDRLHTCR